MLIRPEEPRDHASVYAINASAFQTDAEARLVEVLRKEAHPLISLVAEEKGDIEGHILFSPVTLSGYPELKIMGLGPMAVAVEKQHRGIGSALVRAGLEKCQASGYGAVVVLGHIWFYPRFGFLSPIRYGIKCEYDVPQDAFMLLEIIPGYLQSAIGTIRYLPAFNNV